MLTMAPELRPYSALKVELSTLNSDTVLIDGWNVTCEFDRSFRLMPLTIMFTEVSRLPAVMNENAPWPRSGALSPAFCGDVDPPGIDADTYWPAESVTAARSVPVATFLTVIDTPGRKAFCESVTAPWSVAVD